MTRTLVESPVINSLLAVRLRSVNHMDVAFVGVSTLPIFSLLFHRPVVFVAASTGHVKSYEALKFLSQDVLKSDPDLA